MVIWYISSVLVTCSKENLATLPLLAKLLGFLWLGPSKKPFVFLNAAVAIFGRTNNATTLTECKKKSYLQSNGPAHSSICFKWQNKIEKWRQFFIRFNRYFLLNHDSEGLD
jgi:hypothetical protein